MMGIEKCIDAENTEIEDLEEPFLGKQGNLDNDQSGSIWMVLLSSFVAVCGSFEFGSCVSTHTNF